MNTNVINTLGIIGAMEEEIILLKNEMEVLTVIKKASMEFYQGTLSGKKVVIVKSGIGKVNAGICTQILIDDFKVEGVINTGIAGSLKNEINIGDIVVSTDALQHDVDVREFGYPLGQIPRMKELSFPADERFIDCAFKSCRRVNPKIQVFKGRVVSGDQFIADKEVKDMIIKNFNAYCTEMEGAAIAQVACLNHIPYVVLRAISDKADNSATVDYPTFEKEAIEHSVKLVKEMVKSI
jgi:adenosylhomocysteine nucleosidase